MKDGKIASEIAYELWREAGSQMTSAPRPPGPHDFLPEVPSFTLTSTDISDGKRMPDRHASGAFGVDGGEDVSPELSWSGAPAGTQSCAVTCYDPDAPTGTVHAVDVPALELPDGATPAYLGFNLFSHTLARATLVGTFGR